MISKKDIWKTKVEDLQALATEKGISFDPENFDRRAVIESLLALDTDEPLNGSGDAPGREYGDIIFHNQDNQPKLVFLGHQGRSMWLPREVTCRIPAEFMESVKHAVQPKLVQAPTADGKLSYRTVMVPRFSYEVVGHGRI